MQTSSKRLHIFLVEDNYGDVLLVQESLRRLPYKHELTVARDGEEALEVLKAMERKPDLMLLDLNLPKRGGPEVLKAVRADARFRRLPVAVLTSSYAPPDRDEAARLKADEYMTKPLDPDALAAFIVRMKIAS